MAQHQCKEHVHSVWCFGALSSAHSAFGVLHSVHLAHCTVHGCTELDALVHSALVHRAQCMEYGCIAHGALSTACDAQGMVHTAQSTLQGTGHGTQGIGAQSTAWLIKVTLLFFFLLRII